MADDWHGLFKDFPDMDPANSHLSPEELAKLPAPGWEWVAEQEERATAEPERTLEGDEDDSEPDPA